MMPVMVVAGTRPEEVETGSAKVVELRNMEFWQLWRQP